MPLERAKTRQGVLENLLREVGGIEIDLNDLNREALLQLMEVMNKQLEALSYLAFNVRDCIMLLNRQNPDGPDGRTADGAMPQIGPRIGDEGSKKIQ